MRSHEAIPGWFNFSRAYSDAVDLAKPGARFVEVGCWAGRSAVFLAEQILTSRKNITLHCVDHWKGSPEHKDNPELADIYETFMRNTERLRKEMGERFVVIRDDSARAAKCFTDESLDFVWLDAGHDYKSVAKDIKAWLPKIRQGGVLGGDDYPMEGVRKAVDEAFPRARRISENGWTTWWHDVRN